MNRDELDAFFAKAEDVLDDWPGSLDAMDTEESRLFPFVAPYINLDAFEIVETSRTQDTITYRLTLREFTPPPFRYVGTL